MKGLQTYISRLLNKFWKNAIKNKNKDEKITYKEYLELIAELEKMYNIEINPITYTIKKRS